ncbi:heavy-metal-associated domain-containing protein [Clostridium sp. Sa3CUN1]|uniref:Heavy-metal-associated domain-containing protein n=1 Tax=Clostridium gallinarum TaxID=2762246 RepID=A0ABR8Q1P1_9CLOT|nr:heavy-metal-associated domain-containing protein [Clostridium gallinarum]MBD7914337.1 heavy-metal-associated domain-containing protein [Clostridium gallinarum]
MKVVLKVSNLNTNDDVISIKDVISHNEGVIACEISIAKKEVNIVYDEKATLLDNIIASIEELGYSVN